MEKVIWIIAIIFLLQLLGRLIRSKEPKKLYKKPKPQPRQNMRKAAEAITVDEWTDEEGF
jgi:hypothetical protein